MKANELRIGSVTDKGIVKSFWEKGVHVGFGKCFEFDELEPIPLTEEWLPKFGIIKKNGYPYKFNKGYLKLRNGIFFFKYYEIEIELPFVHDLQNLNFALTNEELKIK